jgi:membrane-associated protein
VSALTSLHTGSVISYAIAVVLPALDAILPVLPSETVIIALGVATAGSTDPRIALLVACAAAGAFLGDNLSYFLGHRFGPHVERRFFATGKGARQRAWAERSLARFGMQLIIVCRFIPGGRTAVTLSCGLIGYSRRRFIAATAVAAIIWALYSFFIGRLGGAAFEGKPWAGFLVSLGATLVISGLIEGARRIRRASRPPGRPGGPDPGGSGGPDRSADPDPGGSGGPHPGGSGGPDPGGSSGCDPGQVEADHSGQDQPDRHQLQGGYRVPEEGHADRCRPGRADSRPHRVGRPDLELAQRGRQQGKTGQRTQRESDGRPRPGHPVAQLQGYREPGLEYAGRDNEQPRHRVTSRSQRPLGPCPLDSARARNPGVPVMECRWRTRHRRAARTPRPSATIQRGTPQVAGARP